MLSSHKSVRWAVTAIGVFAAMMLVSSAAQAQTVVYVDDDAPPLLGGDGLSWGTAYRFLADALTFACDPKNGITEVRVGQGVYLPYRDEPRVLAQFVRFSQEGSPSMTCVLCASGWPCSA